MRLKVLEIAIIVQEFMPALNAECGCDRVCQAVNGNSLLSQHAVILRGGNCKNRVHRFEKNKLAQRIEHCLERLIAGDTLKNLGKYEARGPDTLADDLRVETACLPRGAVPEVVDQDRRIDDDHQAAVSRLFLRISSSEANQSSSGPRHTTFPRSLRIPSCFLSCMVWRSAASTAARFVVVPVALMASLTSFSSISMFVRIAAFSLCVRIARSMCIPELPDRY